MLTQASLLRRSGKLLAPAIFFVGLNLGVGFEPSQVFGAEESPKEIYDSLFAEDVQRVSRTRETEDDVALAGQMIEAARTSRKSPALAKLICDRVFVLGSKAPAGYDVAVEAMSLLSELYPDKRAVYHQKGLTLLQRAYDRSPRDKKAEAASPLLAAQVQFAMQASQAEDYGQAVLLFRRAAFIAKANKLPEQAEYEAMQADADARNRVAKQIKLYQARLKSKPEDPASNAAMAMLLTAEKDQPLEASKHAEFAGNDTLLENVLLATQPVKELRHEEAYSLAEWYETLAEKATRLGKFVSLGRSKTYYAYFLESDEQSPKTVKAKLRLKKVEDELAKLKPSDSVAVAKGVWVNLLRKVNTYKDNFGGRWRFEGSRLGVEARENAFLTIPYRVSGDYDLRMEFARTKGEGWIGLLIPLNRQRPPKLSL